MKSCGFSSFICETLAKKGFTDSCFDGSLHLPLLKSVKQVGGIQLFSSI